MVQVTKFIQETNYSFLWIFCSACFFFISNYVIYKLTPPLECPSSLSKWEFRNSGTSLVHAVITGMWSLGCLFVEPMLLKDLVNENSNSAHILISVCIGYFVYDFIDMCINNMGRTTIELLGHHVCVIAAFLIPVLNYKYVGLALTGILVEINSVFLHIRHMLQLRGIAKSARFYHINSYLNVVTFLIFRLAVLTFITTWIQQNRMVLPYPVYVIGIVAGIVVTVMNYILFYRVISADFLKRKDHDNVFKHIKDRGDTFLNDTIKNYNNFGKHE